MSCSTKRVSRRYLPLGDAVLPAYGRTVDFRSKEREHQLDRWRD